MLEQQTLKSREFFEGHPVGTYTVENEAGFAIVFSGVESQAIDLGARAGLCKKRGYRTSGEVSWREMQFCTVHLIFAGSRFQVSLRIHAANQLSARNIQLQNEIMDGMKSARLNNRR